MQHIGTAAFSVQKDSKCFVSEMSLFREVDLFQRIYPDACDAGFIMESSRTGNTATWYFSKELMYGRGEDLELGGWEFLPTHETVKKMPHLKDWSVTIFND